MERFISKTGIIFTLIFSFLLSLFNSNTSSVTALGEEIVEHIELTKTEREDNIIYFTTKDRYQIKKVTYEIVYYGGDNQKYADLIRDAVVTKVNNYKYSFEVDSDTIGVKIWQLEFLLSIGENRVLQTVGNNSVGELDAIYKKNFVSVETDMLEVLGGDRCGLKGFENITCFKMYVFYFNLDTEIDKIIKLDMRYKIKTEKKTWWGLNKDSYTKTYEITLDHTQQVIDWDGVVNHFDIWASDKTKVSMDEVYSELLFASETYKRDVLGANNNGNGYDWYVQPLLDDTLTDKQYLAGSGYQRQDLQEVAILDISYYSHGEYFEDIPVLDEPTGWIKYEKNDKDFWDWLVETINKIIDFFGGNIFAVILFFIIAIFIIIALIKLGIKKTFQGICWIVEKIVSIILNLLKSIICLPFIILKKIFGKKQE